MAQSPFIRKSAFGLLLDPSFAVVALILVFCFGLHFSSINYNITSFEQNSGVQEPDFLTQRQTRKKAKIARLRKRHLTQLQKTEVTHVVRRGDTLAEICRTRSISLNLANALVKSSEKAGHSLRNLKIGEELHFTFNGNSSSALSSLTRKLDAGGSITFVRQEHDDFTPIISGTKISRSERLVSGTVISSFSSTAKQVSIPFSIVDEFVDIFSNRVEFRRDFQPGDSFTLIYVEKRSEDGRLLESNEIKAAMINSQGRIYAAIQHEGNDGKKLYFDESGTVLGNFFLRYPLKFSRISSVFTSSRFHPVLRTHRAHNGVDFAAPIGTPVRAIADGTITFAGYNGGSGLMLKIKHGSRYSSAYLHLSRLSKGLKVGSKVTRGDVIAAVGQSGLATGPHLHFSFYDNGRYIDPLKTNLPQLSPSNISIPAKILQAKLQLLKTHNQTFALASNAAGEKKVY